MIAGARGTGSSATTQKELLNFGVFGAINQLEEAEREGTATVHYGDEDGIPIAWGDDREVDTGVFGSVVSGGRMNKMPVAVRWVCLPIN